MAEEITRRSFTKGILGAAAAGAVVGGGVPLVGGGPADQAARRACSARTTGRLLTATECPVPTTDLKLITTSGTSLKQGTTTLTSLMKGFNVDYVNPGWSSAQYGAMAGLWSSSGPAIVRVALYWGNSSSSVDDGTTLQPVSRTTYSKAYIDALDCLISYCNANGIYVILNIYYGPGTPPIPPNPPGTTYIPKWVASGAGDITSFTADDPASGIPNGKWITQFLANRYGSNGTGWMTGQTYPAPNTIFGFGINEPGPHDADNDPNRIVNIYGSQAEIFTWYWGTKTAPGYAPNWIGLVSAGYGANAPYPNALHSGHSDQSWHVPGISPYPNPFTMPVVLDLHHYQKAVSAVTNPQRDGRDKYGTVLTSGTDWAVKVDSSADPAYPPLGYSRLQCQQMMTAYAAPFVQMASTLQVPWIVGESGFTPASPSYSNPDQQCDDLLAALGTYTPHPVAHLQWDYDVSHMKDKWSAFDANHPYGYNTNNFWQIWTNHLFSGKY